MATTPRTVVTPGWVRRPGAGGMDRVTGDDLVFATPITDVGPVVWPWWWFGGGCRITVRADRFDVTFLRPNGSPVGNPMYPLESAAVGAALGTSHSLAGLFDVHAGRAAGKRWRSLLPGQ